MRYRQGKDSTKRSPGNGIGVSHGPNLLLLGVLMVGAMVGLSYAENKTMQGVREGVQAQRHCVYGQDLGYHCR